MENISTMPLNSTKWKNWIDFLYTFLFLFLFPGTGKYFTNPFYFHEMEKTEMIYTTSKLIKNTEYRETVKYGKKWSNFLYFSTYLTLFPQSRKHFIVAIYFHEMQKVMRFSLFLYTYFFSFSIKLLNFSLLLN